MPVALATLLLLVATLTGCGSGSTGATTLTVYAAASLTQPFAELGSAFEAGHDGVRVKFNFAGSSDLVAQLDQGAPADVFASADTRNMTRATRAGLVADPTVFAQNTLMIAVPPGNPARITGLRDLARPGLDLVVCAPQVPCGTAAHTLAEEAGLDLDPVSEEQSVTDVLNKVTTGQADAGLVYLTDVRSAGDEVEGIAFREAATAVNDYLIGRVDSSEHRQLAKEFVDLVTGPQGRRVLGRAGFAEPRP